MRKLAVFVLGLIACLALPPISLWPFMLAAFAGHFFIMNTVHSENRGAGLSYLFGFGYFFGGLFWVGNATLVDWQTFWWVYPFALIGLPLILSLFWGLAGYITIRFSRPHSSERYILYILCFCITEGLRGFVFTGFPWNLPGYTWDSVPQMLQITSIGGIYLLTLLTIAIGVSIGSLISCRRMKTPYRLKDMRTSLSIVFILLLPITFIYGVIRYNHETPKDTQTAYLLVQPNIPQKDKWDPEQMPAHIGKLIALSTYNKEKFPNIPEKQLYIVWPETAISQAYIEHPPIKEQVVEALASWPVEAELLTGVIHAELEKDKPNTYYNSLYHIGSRGQIMARYDKTRLVPFGEFIPFPLNKLVTPITGFTGFKHGKTLQPFITAEGKNIYPLICYETIFPRHLPTRRNNETAAALLSITDDSWYGHTSAPYQHNAIARVRAIEQGMPMVRSANTGISSVVDAYGHPRGQKIGFNKMDSQLFYPNKAIEKGTFYAKYGQLLFYLVLLILTGCFYLSKQKPQKH